MTDKTQPLALMLAEQYDYGDPVAHSNTWKAAVCTELRSQHARIAELEAELEAVGAGGVQALSVGPAGFVPVSAFDRLHAHAESLAARLLAAEQAAPKAAPVEPVHGDVLPPMGSRVYIRHGRDNDAHACTVTGYYAWGDLGGDKRLHRVFVRLVYEGTDRQQARMLCDCYPTAEAALAQAAPQQEAQEPALFVSAKQLADLVDPSHATGGSYLPARKTRAGLFTQPLYTAPQPAPAPLSEVLRDLLQVATAYLGYINALPSDVVASLPAMPGIDGDWAAGVMHSAALAAQGGK